MLLLTAAMAFAELRLTPCEITGSQNSGRVSADCGSLEVAENPDDPDGRQLQLFVARIPALTAEPAADAFTIINGGPGASSVSLYADLPHAFASVLRERDIILLDQRGTGRSGALDCPLLESAVDTYAEDRVMDATRRCLESLDNDPRFFTTSVAVKDLEALRETLGYQQWNIYGVSYGTRVAQHYVRRYPQSVRSLIIDGVVPPEASLGPDIAVNAQHTLDALLDRCREDSSCSTRFPGLNKRLQALSLRLKENPLSLDQADPVTGRVAPFEFTYPHLASTLRLLSYAPETASLIPLMISEATERENFVPLASQAMRIENEVAGAISFGMHNSVVCTEDVPFYEDLDDRWRELDATYLGRDQVQALQTICKVWPVGQMDADFKQTLDANVPALLLSGEFDPITPPDYAHRAAGGLNNSLELVARGQGHGVAGRGCLPQVIGDFVAAGSLDELETECIERMRPQPFFVDLLGPDP